MKRFLTLLLLALTMGAVLLSVNAAQTQDVTVLEADATGLEFTGDTYVDLNGHSLSGVTVTGGTLYCMDSQTADFTVADGIYGKLTNVSGAVAACEGYLQVTGEEGISFHRVALEITDMTLRPDCAGVYYKCDFSGDEMVADRVQRYGVALSLQGEPTAEALGVASYFTDFQPGQGSNSGSSTLLRGIMKPGNRQQTNASNAELEVYGRAYLQTAEGYVFGATVRRSLRQQLELVDTLWETLEETQQAAVEGMYQAYTAILDSWNIPNILDRLQTKDRLQVKLPHTDQFLYRLGNLNAVKLGALFTQPDAEALEAVTVTVTSLLDGSRTDFYTVTGSTAWADTTLDFADDFTGPVSVTVAAKRTNPVTLKLQVINAKNITKAESASAYDVVLLNDISGSFSVTNGHTFHGNGFTVTLPTGSIQKVSSGYTGYISIGASQNTSDSNGGNLDNVRIEGPVYPEMYLYREQAIITDPADPDYDEAVPKARYFKNSVLVYGGNVTISNSYISGSRTAVCLRGGNNVTIENTTLSGGAYANLQVCAGSTVTLRDLTTVQVDKTDSYGLGKNAHGMGISVDSDVVEIYIEGALNQHNWVSASKWDEMIPDAYESSFPAIYTNEKYSRYWHYLDGGEEPYVNLAMVFACNWDKTKIHDSRADVAYETCDATIAGVAGGVYTKVNTIGGNAVTAEQLAEPLYMPTGFAPIAPKLIFDNSPNHDEDDPEDDSDSYCVYDEATGTVRVGVQSGTKVLDLSKVRVTKDGQELVRYIYLGLPINTNSMTVNPALSKKQTITIKATVQDMGYDINGQPIEGTREYTWKINVESALLSNPAPQWNMGDQYQFDAADCVYAYFNKASGYGEAVPIYEGIKVSYYNKSGTLVEKDFSGTTTLPTFTDTSNTTAFTYKLSDGSTLTMKFAGGWKSGATSHQFTAYQSKVYIYPEALDNDNYIRAKTTNQDFDVKITYTFTDPNGQSTAAQIMRWYNPKATNGSVPTVQWKVFDSENAKEDTCVTPDTLVTLADGTQKEIRYVTYEDRLLVWDFVKGVYTAAPASIVMNHGYDSYTVAALTFDDGTVIKTINGHGFFHAGSRKYVILDETNAGDHIGQEFVKQTGDGYTTVKLAAVETYEENTECWSLLSAVHFNCILEGMFTLTPAEIPGSPDYLMPFVVDGNLKYDPAAMQADVDCYGLFTYEELADYVTYEQFVAFDLAIWKVSIGKGYITWKELCTLIKIHL